MYPVKNFKLDTSPTFAQEVAENRKKEGPYQVDEFVKNKDTIDLQMS